MRYKNDILALTETWASKANCKQRRGRAGRVKEGVCYKLFTRTFEKKHMQNQQTPEILRTPLHQLCLSIKASGFGDIKSFLSESLDAPDTSEVESALKYLKQLNVFNSQSEELSALGRSMSIFPMDVRLSKLLIFGAVLGCLDPILTIAACLNGRPVFLNPRENREEAKEYFLFLTLGNRRSLLLCSRIFLLLTKLSLNGPS
jgi:ATP-dependent RNA helicase DHX57